jgi:DNA-directed RNA polymerase specialized sigma24 family protein
VIELRFFVGLSVQETAEVLKISADTVLRDWTLFGASEFMRSFFSENTATS